MTSTSNQDQLMPGHRIHTRCTQLPHSINYTQQPTTAI